MSASNNDPAVVPQKEQQQQQQQAATTAATTTVTEWQWPNSADKYNIQSKIGRGAFATVYRAECESASATNAVASKDEEATSTSTSTTSTSTTSTTRGCAIKILDLEHFDTHFAEVRSEILALRLSKHDNVLEFYTCFVHSATHQLFLVTQLMTKGSSLRCLHEARKAGIVPMNHGLREEWITFILHETLRGLQYFHDNGQIHRDVKAGNILIDDMGQVRLADFGVSGWLISADRSDRRDRAKTFVGTPCWMAPEVMEQVTGYDYRADLWSLGITALELAKGHAPYAKYPPMKVLLLTIQESPPNLDTYDMLDDDDDGGGFNDDDDTAEHDYAEEYPRGYRSNQPQQFTKQFHDLIRQCLEKDPHRRPQSCKALLSNHRQFKPYYNASSATGGTGGMREKRRLELKRDLCDLIPDVGGGTTTDDGDDDDNNGGSRRRNQQQRLPGSTPIYPVLDKASDRPPGTSWVFTDGSQVFSNSDDHHNHDDDDDDDDDGDGGSGGAGAGAGTAGNGKTKTKGGRGQKGDFFDEFEKKTGGESYQKQPPPPPPPPIAHHDSDNDGTGDENDDDDDDGGDTIHTTNQQQHHLSSTVQPQRSREELEEMEDFFDEFEKTTGGENCYRDDDEKQQR